MTRLTSSEVTEKKELILISSSQKSHYRRGLRDVKDVFRVGGGAGIKDPSLMVRGVRPEQDVCLFYSVINERNPSGGTPQFCLFTPIFLKCAHSFLDFFLPWVSSDATSVKNRQV